MTPIMVLTILLPTLLTILLPLDSIGTTRTRILLPEGRGIGLLPTQLSPMIPIGHQRRGRQNRPQKMQALQRHRLVVLRARIP